MSDTSQAISVAMSVTASVPIESEIEANLDQAIKTLWTAHCNNKATAHRTKGELQSIRRDLGERLSEMKSTLVRTGRGGGWAAYLRSLKLPRATADRYVRECGAMLNPQTTNRLTDSISEPTDAEVKGFARRILPRLQKVLITKEAVFRFVCELVAGLPAADACISDFWIEVSRPAPEDRPSPGQEMARDTLPLGAVS